MTSPISPRDADVLAFIIAFTEEIGYPPTVREIGKHLGMNSPSTVQAHIVSLKEAGYIERDGISSPRAIRILIHPAAS